MAHNPNDIARYFDEFGEREWDRLEADAPARVSLHTHQRLLERYITAGDRVLEAGAGAGRFTVELLGLGAEITVGDISEEQLRLNRERTEGIRASGSVGGWEVLDILDLSRFPDGTFDAVVCYGGPLSYVFDGADRAMRVMLRVTRPGGYVLLSVMSLAGATRRFLEGVHEMYSELGPEAVEGAVKAGDLQGAMSSNGHECRMYRWSDLEALLERHGCKIVDASASNFLSVQNEEFLETAREDAIFWKDFLKWETEFCGQPGALDGGTHIIAVVQSI